LILYRYINRQLFTTTVVVTFVLTMVLVSGRFIKYMAEAATGDIAADALFTIMFFRLPEFLQMILPLSFYISILLVFGRMYVDNEMVVLKAGGVGPGRTLRAMILPVLMTTAVIGAFSLYVTPHGDERVARIFDQQKDRSVLELLSPGRFHARGTDEGHRATYAESLDREAGELGNVFISDLRYADSPDESRMLTVWARTGRIVEEDGINYLQLGAGRQYQGRPGQADYRVVEFQQARVRIGEQEPDTGPPEVKGRPTLDLLQNPDHEETAELQWRLSLILITPLMMLVAVPLSRVTPRQGLFMRLVPALLIFMFYLGLLLVMRSWIADVPDSDPVPWYFHMGWVHLGVILGIVLLYSWPRLTGRRAG
jgi:lipopolysaccharide export system permease protein